MALVGFLFALVVLAEWYWRERGAPRRKARLAAREECSRLGHRWGEPFDGLGTRHRNCTRCDRQEHHHRESDSWR